MFAAAPSGGARGDWAADDGQGSEGEDDDDYGEDDSSDESSESGAEQAQPQCKKQRRATDKPGDTHAVYVRRVLPAGTEVSAPRSRMVSAFRCASTARVVP